ncbi:30S ribosomal protein S18 [Candidatus Parcubacteria bacterium]|nr:MAG: 30S ribosomal protein S18 [Candidatus Parcubacteria bacterium]
MAENRPNRSRRSKKREVKKECFFDKEKKEPNFLEPEILSKFISERGKILSRTRTGLCASDQRKLTSAVKRARHLGLLPFVVKPE